MLAKTSAITATLVLLLAPPITRQCEAAAGTSVDPSQRTQGAGRLVQRLTLSAAQQQTIYQSVANKPGQESEGAMPAIRVGDKAPRWLQLNELPSVAKNVGGSLPHYRYAKLQNGNLLLVEPRSGVVVAVITNNEARRKDKTR